MNSVTYIEASGTNYDIGCITGECLKERLIAHRDDRQAFYKDFAAKHNSPLDQIIQGSEKILAEHFPQYLEELRGVADGSSISLRDILLMCSEEVILNGATNKCTTFAYRGTESVILGHNEDWEAGYEDRLYVVKAKPKKGAAFLSLAYVVTLGGSSVALNEHGIAFSGNSIFEGAQQGVPKNIILRSQIEAKNIEQFAVLATFKPRAIPNHSMTVDSKGGIVSVEVGLHEHSVFFTSGSYVHTNHPIHSRMTHWSDESSGNSITRHRTAQAIISGRTLDDNLAKEILRSHENQPNAICIHPQAEGCSHNQTVASAIVNLLEMSLAVTMGNPCKSPYKKFHL